MIGDLVHVFLTPAHCSTQAFKQARMAGYQVTPAKHDQLQRKMIPNKQLVKHSGIVRATEACPAPQMVRYLEMSFASCRSNEQTGDSHQ